MEAKYTFTLLYRIPDGYQGLDVVDFSDLKNFKARG